MNATPIPSSLDGAVDQMRRFVDGWCDRHDGGIAALDQVSTFARHNWHQMGVDLADPQVAAAVALALDGFVRCVFSDAHLAVSAIRARAYVTPLAAVLIDTLDKETCT